MKKKILLIIIIVFGILAISGMLYAGITLKAKEKEEDSHLIELTFDELQTKIDNKDTFILVLSQTSCSHCAEYKPILKEVLTEYNIYAYEVSIDKLSKEENAKLKDIASANGTPTTIFINEGIEINTSTRLVGTQGKTKIINRLKAMGYIE